MTYNGYEVIALRYRMPTAQTTRLTYRYRLYPTRAQAVSLNEALAVCRDVYNALVHERAVLYETTGKAPGWAAQCRAVTSWKGQHPELASVFSQVLQNVVKRVDLAFQTFFRRVKNGEEPGYPRLKGKGQYDSLTSPQYEKGFSFVQGRLRLSKIGDVAIRLHRPIEGTVKTCTVRRTATGKWYACFCCEAEPEPDHLPPSKEEVGIDVGLKVFAALSSGEVVENPRFFRKDEEALAKAQRKAERLRATPSAKCPSERVTRHGKNKGRVRKAKAALARARKAVARIHERVRHRRHDFCHQTARGLVDRFGVIAVEALSVGNMMSRPAPRPDPENEGRFLPNGASRKSGLNKSIADASWSMFRNVLTTKAERAGRRVVAVPAHYTTQKCSACGDIVQKTLDVRVHRCPSCGLVLDRDTNAAVNIAALGQQSLATRVA